MSPGPSDDELERKSGERTRAVDRTADELGNLGDNVDEAARLAGEAQQNDAKLRGMLGAVLDQDKDFFDYSSRAMGNLNDDLKSHISDLAGLHDKVDRNRREFLAIAGAGAIGYDWINASSEDEPGTGPISYGEGDLDAWGMYGDQGNGAAKPAKKQGYLDRNTLPTIRDETENHFRNILDENEWSYGTDNEGMDLAGLSVRQEDDDFDYKLFHINVEEVTGDGWMDAESTDELLESYDSVRVSGWESVGNEDLGEYMLDASKSENPEKLDFDDYLED